jgi:hypothetical protein
MQARMRLHDTHRRFDHLLWAMAGAKSRENSGKDPGPLTIMSR